MKAIILAAGMGSRLRPMTDERPKPLVMLGEKSIIERSIDNLLSTGVSHIAVVTGYMSDALAAYIVGRYPRKNIEFFHNPEYVRSNSALSLITTAPFVDDNVLVLEGDLIYEPSALTSIISQRHRNCILASDISGSGDEVYLRFDEKFKLQDLGKSIDPLGAKAELVGISKCTPEYYRGLSKFLAENPADRYLLHYEEAYLKYSKSSGVPMYICYHPNLVWREIDKIQDYKYVINNVIGKLDK